MSVFTQYAQLLTGTTTKPPAAAAPLAESAATPASTEHVNLQRELSSVQRHILARTGQRISIAAARTTLVARTASRLPGASSNPASSDPEHNGPERASLAPLSLQRLHGLPQASPRILQVNGVRVVPNGAERAFLAPLPLQRLYGVPAPTLRLLQGSGLVTIGELQRVPKGALQAAFGPSEGLHLWRSARGLDPLPKAQRGFRGWLITRARPTANSRKRNVLGNVAPSASQNGIRSLIAQSPAA